MMVFQIYQRGKLFNPMIFDKNPKLKTNKNKISLDEIEVWGDSEDSSGILVSGDARENPAGRSQS